VNRRSSDVRALGCERRSARAVGGCPGAPGARAFVRGWILAAVPFLPLGVPAALGTVGLAVSARHAHADEAERLLAQLEGDDEAARTAAFKALEGRGAQVGAVLGPLLRRDPPSDAAARAAAWLAERPVADGNVMLVDDVVRRGRMDPSFPRAVLRYAPATSDAWARLVAAARRAARDAAAPDDLRRGGASFLAVDPSVESVGVLAELWATATGELAREAGQGVEGAVAFTFPDAAAARTWVEANAKIPFLEAVRGLSWLKDTSDYPVYARMVRESQAIIAKTTTLAELAGYLRPQETPWPEVRRLAAEQGYRVTADVKAWLDLLADILRDEDDAETLRRLLLVAASLEVKDETSMRSAPLADAIVLRLRECCALPKAQQGLLELLARVGDTTAVEAAQPWAEQGRDPAVLEAWLRAAAAVGGLDDRICAIHQTRATSEKPDDVEIRVRAIDALGARRAQGQRAWQLEAVARSYLYGILRREDAITSGMVRESVPAARAAAIRALEAFPDVGTYARLRQLAEAPPEDPELARLAGSVLAKLASRDPEAGPVLLDLAANGNLPEARRDAVANLARVVTEPGGLDGATPEAVLAAKAAREALRPRIVAFLRAIVSDTAGDLGFRTAAADTAAQLAEPALLDAVVTLVVDVLDREEPVRVEAQAALERLALATARAGGAHDGEIARTLARLARAGGAAAAIPIADGTAEAGGARLTLQVLRAALRFDRARAATDAEPRKADLLEAHRILRSTLTAGAAGDAAPAVFTLAQATHRNVAEALLAVPGLEEPVRRSVLFAGLAAVVQLGDATSVGKAQSWLAEARALPGTPTDDEKTTLEAFLALSKRLAPPAPR